VTSKLNNQSEIAQQPEFRHNPGSFFALILLSFSLLGLPLIFALFYSVSHIGKLAEHSRKTIYQVTQITYGSSVLIDEIMTMRRSIQHVHILEDITLLNGYIQAHDKFEKMALKLKDVSPHLEQKLILDELQLSELRIYSDVLTLYESPQSFEGLIERFDALLVLAKNFSQENNRLTGQQVNEMTEMATHVRELINLNLMILVPLVIILALGLSFLIARPLKQIDEAIDNLGKGILSNPVSVGGPENLKYLGSRLDWMRRRLLELEEQKIQFLRHVSHELKTPLTAIREGANLLVEGVTGSLNKKQQQIAEILRGSSIQLQKRIEDLLSFSALQVDKTALVKQRADLAQIIQNVLKDQNLSIISKKISIDLSCPKLLLDCDQQKVGVIIDNLVSNAIKFSPMGGPIKISALQLDKMIQLDVIDSGMGIDSAEKNKIFEPFYQGSSMTDSCIKGTGLGLSIAREYALAHGGKVELLEREEHETYGAHFRLTLPVMDPELSHE